MHRTFQFHKGTIKTTRHPSTQTTTPTFQFHKGTIKTYIGFFYLLLFFHFNSIKVQLKRCYD